MAETDSRILEFLEEGLFLYGVGKVQESIARWKKVLELDPKNERALDYIESAGGDVSAYRRSASKPPMQKPPGAGPSPSKAPFASPMPPPPGIATPSKPAQPSPVATAPMGSSSPTIPPRMPPSPVAPPPGATPWQQAPQIPPSSQMPWQSPPPSPPPQQAPPQAAFGDDFFQVESTQENTAPSSAAPAAPAQPFNPFAASPTQQPSSDWVPPRPAPPTPPPPQQAAPNPFMPPPAGSETKEQLLGKAAALFRAKYYEAALDLLERVARDFPPMDDNVRGYMDATKTAFLEAMKQQWSRADQVLRPRMAPAQVMQLKLSPEAGFLLSRVDGMATVEEILAMCGLEEFIALRALTTLVQQGAIEVAR